MPTTLKIQSFSESNIRERTTLRSAVVAGETVLPLESTQGIEAGNILYVGALSRETCEKAVVASVDGATAVTVTSGLQYAHAPFDAVTAVLGDLIHVYRAADVDGSVPADEMFSVLATRNIDPDQLATYYTDSSGSSAFWYRSTFYNATTTDETDLSASQPVRGDDFGHYATLGAIRKEAGFENAVNLNDVDVDQQRRAAENEINSALGAYLTVPFTKPIPPIIETITIKLAAGFLLKQAYGDDNSRGEELIKDARALIESLKSGDSSTGEEDNEVASGISGYPDSDGPRLFSVGDQY